MTQAVFANWPYNRSDHAVDCGLFGCDDAEWLGQKQKNLLRIYSLFARYVVGMFLVRLPSRHPAILLVLRNLQIVPQER